MDDKLRSDLRTTITQCRRLLEADLTRQLEGRYGIRAGGEIEAIEKLTQLNAAGKADRRTIETTLQHKQASGMTPAQVVEWFMRESAFTTLNRLAALKLMEHPSRALIIESIGQAEVSKGFKQFQLISPEAIRGEEDGGYRLYLELLFEDLGHGLGVLFDSSLPQSILFPSAACLAEVLGLLNQEGLGEAWGQDETIGWVYQYFTPKEMRDEARAASSAPRNSYELAFRNQFYTPHYVVAFLTDNTLGKTWYEMQGGDTRLVDVCEYMLRPTDEPIYPREKRDPRTLRILDPACGSGHFLLYAFDLLRVIYEEAYEDSHLGEALKVAFPDFSTFRTQIPKLIVERNLYGVDIDPRAVQIASLALWLRAQRAWAEMGIPGRDRPPITRSHIVTAEPMPGDHTLLGEFLKDLKPALLGNLVLEIFEKMQLAGEAGSLLKIEAELRENIARAHQAWTSAPQAIQLDLFGERRAQPVQLAMELMEIQDEAFWEEAEERVLEALQRFSNQAGGTEALRRRLFTHDAVQGFAFIDMLQQPFDVVLMNPPFGKASIPSKEYIRKAYPRTKNDLYAAFVERGLELMQDGGYLGAITSRTGFFLKSFQKWREEILLDESEFIVMADLGQGVLDTAMVETAAYIIKKSDKKISLI